MPIRGVIFDMDGVLVDGEDQMSECAAAALREFGAEAKPSDFLRFRGCGDDAYIGGVAEICGLEYRPEMKKRAYAYYREACLNGGVRVFPGAKALIKTLAARGLKIAIASGADREKVLCNLMLLSVNEREFGAVITAGDKIKPKPNPDIFIMAAVKLGLKPCECLVAEDALSGVKAGKSAGMTVAAVTTSFPREALLGAGADHVLDAVSDIGKIV